MSAGLGHRQAVSIDGVTRSVLERVAACLATGLFGTAVAPFATIAPANAAEETPLRVSISSLTPSTIPNRGSVTITGQITNTSDESWTDLNVYALTSPAPFRTRAELAEANATDPTLAIGPRLTDTGLFDSIGDLAPGSSTNYTLSVPRRRLEISGEAGVYWLGVHVLGASALGRDGVADGRARSFIPLMEAGGPATTLSLVIPVKGKVQRESDGTLSNLEGWHEQLSPEGQLGRLLEFSGTSFDVPLTWVVDPAVLDAATTAASDNAPMSTAPTDGEDQGGEASPSPSPSPSQTPTDGASGEPPGEEPQRSAGAIEAADWLQTFRRQAAQHTVLSVPYGDLDVASALRNDFEAVFEQGTELSAATMEGQGVDSTPVVAPPDGYLPNPVLEQLDPATPVMLSDAAFPGSDRAVVETEDGHQVVLTDSAASAGGPAPTATHSTLAIRQRVISEAALHALSGQRDQPLTVGTPETWDPGSDWRIADFFAGLDVDWITTRDIPGVLANAEFRDGETPQTAESLVYPRSQRRNEIPVPNLIATKELSETGDVFANLLTRNDSVDEFLGKSALLASSATVRRRPRPAAALARETTRDIRNRMEEVRIDGQPFVVMSSEEGTLAVTIINDLQEPVTVGIEADTGSVNLVIPSPDPVELGPGERATVRLRATSKEIGVHSVSLMPTTEDGQPLGNETTFSVRSSQVGLVIWVIMGIGAAVLVIASGIRIAKRVRERKATHGPLLEGTD